MAKPRRATWSLVTALPLMAVGCNGGTSGPDVDSGLPDAPAQDARPPDAGPAPNIGVWCDPEESDAGGNNPTCVGGARCLAMDSPPQNGMCVVFGCHVDLTPTASVNEESCRLLYGSAFVCVDVDGAFADDGETSTSQGQNADLSDNVCVPKCVPRADGNDCNPEFACAPESTRFDFVDAVCLTLSCPDHADCPPGRTCDTVRGVCVPSSPGDPAARIGDPCGNDDECPPKGTCLLEAPVQDEAGQVVKLAPRNGYCTILGCRFVDTLPDLACPAGSACDNSFFAGGCLRNCEPADAAACRGLSCDPGAALTDGCDWLGDFECVDWAGWGFTGTGIPVVVGDTKVCDYLFDAIRSCDQGCATGSTCTDPATGTPSPDGVCLDGTTSGPPCATNGADGAFCAGECVDRDSDPQNCGACGNTCDAPTPNCSGGSCVP
jgi:hypothetical protein